MEKDIMGASDAPKAATKSGAHPEAADFPLREARKLVRDLWQPNVRLYWTDFTIANVLGWGSIAVATLSPLGSIVQIIAVIVATLALYRAVIFIHELAHLRRGTFTWFRRYWNVTCGFPMQVPAYSYADVHIDHHKPKIYGTEEDGEYLPFAVDEPWKIIAFVAQAVFVPGLLALRSLVLVPIMLVSKAFREFVWQRLSSLVIDYRYLRPAPKPGQGRDWMLEDVFTAAYVYAALALVYFDLLPLAFLGIWYVVTVAIFLLNALRTLAAHAYRNGGRERMSQQEEFLDSVDVPGNRYITPLWAPVGLRFHATHHLFPGMPYHNLEKAHERLKTDLPDNRLYLAATRKNLWVAMAQLWREAKAAKQTS
ncbi:fatty acid desaturase family protein [Kordiimonas aestuarii]|uniref:fatty acid desaturase family protein n=1 Tax=Kordiimonas aestuarii TaxID=1005925 RepID=UPI0021D38480|nr:fatty acid desaturase [Kordiimonas aestuarii]